MKRIFAILLAVTLFCSMAVIPVSAEEVAVSSPWEKLLGETTVTTTTENGETIYSFGNITAAYISAGVDLMPELKTLIEGNDKITVKISFEVKIDYNEGYEDEEYVLGALVRASGTNPKIKEPEAFKAYYKDAQAGAFYDTGGGNYAIRAIEQEVVEGSWTPLEGEMTFTATDIKGGLWEKINFCFDRMSNFESCKTIYIKNTTLELVDYEEGDGEIVVDLDEEIEIPDKENETPESEGGAVDTSSVDLTANADAEDTPELPEGNYLDTKWVKGYAANDPIEGTFNDQPMYSMTGWKSPYGSPFLDILPAVKAAMGEEEEITVYIVFDIRAINHKGMEGETHPFGVKIRPKTTDLTKMKEDFEENYFGTNFAHYGEGDVRITLLASDKEEISEDWQRMEFSCTFTAEEVEDGLWEAWNLCFDNVSTFKTLGAIQVKNMGVFYEDDYELVNVEEKPAVDNTEEENKPATKPESSTDPVVIHRPIGGGRYNINFMESVETVVEGGLVDSSNDSAENDGDGEGGTDTTLIIAIIAGVVVVAVAAVVIVVLKKKKLQKEEK